VKGSWGRQGRPVVVVAEAAVAGMQLAEHPVCFLGLLFSPCHIEVDLII